MREHTCSSSSSSHLTPQAASAQKSARDGFANGAFPDPNTLRHAQVKGFKLKLDGAGAPSLGRLWAYFTANVGMFERAALQALRLDPCHTVTKLAKQNSLERRAKPVRFGLVCLSRKLLAPVWLKVPSRNPGKQARAMDLDARESS